MAESLDWLVPGGALSGPVFRTLAWRVADLDEPSLAAGTTIGPFRVLEPLGRGGMASVYLAERADGAYEQRVALKMLHPRLVRVDSGQSLLRRERQILATLDHPAIAALLEGGTTPDGRVWFAMQWIDGTRIDRYCDERAADAGERIRLFLRVVDAIAHAHARGVVHKDIKPSNILVTATGEPKLLDFGIAALTEDVESSATHALTPGYASPEQLRGEPLSAASDVWQLGLLLGKLVAGAKTQRRHELDAIVAQATRELPEDRYRSAAALGDDLRALLAMRPVAASRGNGLHRFALLLRRNRVASLIAFVAIVALATIATTLTLRLVAERDRAVAEGARSRAARRFMTEVFRVSDPGINRGETLTANQILERGRERLATEYQDQPGLRAELLRSIGLVYSELGEQARAQDLLDDAVEAAGRASDLSAAEHAYILSDAAVIRMRRGKDLEARPYLEQALALGAELPAEDRARMLVSMASVRRKLGDTVGARAAYEDVLAGIDDSTDGRLRARGYAQAFLCEIAGDDFGDTATALTWCRRSLESFTRMRDPRAQQEHSQIQVAYALTLASAGDIDEARAQWQQAYAAELRAYGEGHRRTRYALYVAARIEFAAQRYDDALRFLDRAEAEPFPHEGRGAVLSDCESLRGDVALARHDGAAALAAFDRAREFVAQRAAPGHPELLHLDAGRGEAMCVAGRADEGRTLLQATLDAQSGSPAMARDREETSRVLAACR